MPQPRPFSSPTPPRISKKRSTTTPFQAQNKYPWFHIKTLQTRSNQKFLPLLQLYLKTCLCGSGDPWNGSYFHISWLHWGPVRPNQVWIILDPLRKTEEIEVWDSLGYFKCSCIALALKNCPDSIRHCSSFLLVPCQPVPHMAYSGSSAPGAPMEFGYWKIRGLGAEPWRQMLGAGWTSWWVLDGDVVQHPWVVAPMSLQMPPEWETPETPQQQCWDTLHPFPFSWVLLPAYVLVMRCLPPSLRLSGDLGALRDYIYKYIYIYI